MIRALAWLLGFAALYAAARSVAAFSDQAHVPLVFWVPVCAIAYAMAAWRLRGLASAAARVGATVTAIAMCLDDFANAALSSYQTPSLWTGLIVMTAIMAAACAAAIWLDRSARVAHGVLGLGWLAFVGAGVQGQDEVMLFAVAMALFAIGLIVTVAGTWRSREVA
ncbi:hypothetical protein GCM10009853_029320 [Glycomyces scopariae]